MPKLRIAFTKLIFLLFRIMLFGFGFAFLAGSIAGYLEKDLIFPTLYLFGAWFFMTAARESREIEKEFRLSL